MTQIKDMTDQEAQEIGDLMKRQEMRFEWMDPNQLTPNDFNWKDHPAFQRRALRAFREELENGANPDSPETMAASWVGALLYNERTGRLLDGHMRQDEAIERGETRVPVLIVDLDEETENKALFFLDRIGGMYKEDEVLNTKLGEMISSNLDNEILQKLLAAEQAGENLEDEEPEEKEDKDLKHSAFPPGGLALLLGMKFDYVVLMFRTEMDWTAAQDHFGLKRQKCPFSNNVGTGRVIDGAKYLQMVNQKMGGIAMYDPDAEKALAILAAQ